MDNLEPEPAERSRLPGDDSTSIEPGEAARVRAVPPIEGYEVLREIGRGGMGVVYEALHLKLHRTVALKMVLAGEFAGDRVMARFLAEAEIAAGLQHSNIIRIYELGEVMGLPFIAMELVSGGSMSERMRQLGNDFRAISAFFEKLARATHWAHRHAVIHRDLKPANVLIGADGEPKIADFGLAKRLDDDSGRPALTKSGEQMGTPAYMAPEQAFPDMGDIGPATDVYSLGVMLYEVLAGKVPFKGGSHAEVLAKLRSEDPSSPAWLRTGLPRDLETICLKCLRKKPKDRYASAGELADDLRHYIADEPILAKPPSSLTKTFRWVRRHRVSVSVGTTVLIAAAATVGVLAQHEYLSRERERKQQEEHDYLYVREYAETFPAVVRKHGQYRGAGKALTDEEVSHRALSFRIVRAGQEGRCLRVVRSGPDGKPAWLFANADLLVPGLLDGAEPHRLPCVSELRYNQDGAVSEERVSDASGRLITRFRYNYPEGYDPALPQSDYITGDFVDEFSAPMKSASGLSTVQIVRNGEGRELRLLYADAHGRPQKDKNGAGGIQFSYHPDGMVSEFTALDTEGKPAPNNDGKATVRLDWKCPGQPLTEAHFDVNGMPATVKGVHLTRFEYDQWGNLTGNRAFAPDGATPARLQLPRGPGFSEGRWTFNEHGRPETLTTSGYDPAVSRYASIVTRYAWKSDGLTASETALDSHGNPVRGPLGFQSIESDFDPVGRLLRRQRDGFDPEVTGYVRDIETTTWSPAGDKWRSERRQFGPDGKPAPDRSSGAASSVKEYDAAGLLSRETLREFNPDEVPYAIQVLDYEWESESGGARRFPGIADEWRSEVSELSDTKPSGLALARSGKVRPGPVQSAANSRSAKLLKKTGRYFDRHDQPATTTKGNHQWQREFDTQGRERKEIHTGFHPKEYPYARVVITTDWNPNDNGRSVIWHYEDESGKPVHNKERYLRYIETYDAGGHVLRIVEDGHDETRKPYTRVEISVTRDAEKSEKSISWNYFNAAGQPVRNDEGYGTYTEVHDGAGRGVRRIQSGYDADAHGYFKETMTSEWDGDKLSRRHWAYTDAAGNRVRYKGDYMDYTESYDTEGNFRQLVISGYDPVKFPFFKKTTEIEDGAGGETSYRVSRWETEDGKQARGLFGQLESREEWSLSDNRPVKVVATGYDEAQYGFVRMTGSVASSGGVDTAEYFDSRGAPVTRVRPHVRSVVPGSPASRLHLKPGDAILAYNDRTTGNMFDYINHTELTGGRIEILRDGRRIILNNVPPGELGVYLEDRVLPP